MALLIADGGTHAQVRFASLSQVEKSIGHGMTSIETAAAGPWLTMALAGFTTRPAILPWSGPCLIRARCGT
jgi:hypothetical protein